MIRTFEFVHNGIRYKHTQYHGEDGEPVYRLTPNATDEEALAIAREGKLMHSLTRWALDDGYVATLKAQRASLDEQIALAERADRVATAARGCWWVIYRDGWGRLHSEVFWNEAGRNGFVDRLSGDRPLIATGYTEPLPSPQPTERLS